ncbi:HAD family hydrolase [Luteimicrobium sp. DT211]|uniref:HAD family hydrolase n=1 Tax=Luteimicrobium sp. DT211 TaxID=3393412 RepID=UPI003CEB5D51
MDQGPGVLFDVDGTLVDSNYLQVAAWLRALQSVGLDAPAWRLHRALGRTGRELVGDVVGDAGLERFDEISGVHAREVDATADRLRRTRGAAELVRAVAARGARTVLATSASAESLEALRRVLDLDDVLTAVTSAEDVERSKPHPEPVRTALASGGVDPAHAVFVGDSVWDVQAAAAAGLPCVGLLCGGIGADELLAAGAVELYDDPADLLDHLDASALRRAW